jgi:hypothetical protein
VLLAHATEPPPPFASVGASGWASPAVEAVVQNCLAKNPADRPSSARELAERFDAALQQDPLLQVSDNAMVQPQGVVEATSQETPPPAQTSVIAEYDPGVVVHRLQAWMPEKIAVYKLRGFVSEAEGEIVENVPGMIRMRLGGKGSPYRVRSHGGPLAWLGLGRKSGLIDVELRLERCSNPGQQSLLLITVTMRSPDCPTAPTDPVWRERCTQVFCDLRAHLMAEGSPVPSPTY